MTITQINYVNIALMLTSCVIAFNFPFELVLISYAFLGPAHYLTQISWLHDRNYFTKRKYDFALLSLITVSLVLCVIVAPKTRVIPVLLWISLACAGTMAFSQRYLTRFIAIVGITLLALVTADAEIENYSVLFIPTLVHVYLFTGAFILQGSLKSRSFSGILSLVVFIGCALSFFILPTGNEPPTLSSYAQANSGIFDVLARELLGIFNLNSEGYSLVPAMGFISFAYTYHYLNWFSKTEIIKWHEISKRRAAVIIVLYLVSIGIYLIDYKIGFIVLLYLSTLHVVLEFPLNFRTFVSIGKDTGKFISSKSVSA